MIENYNNFLKRDNYEYLYLLQFRIGTHLIHLGRYHEAFVWMESSAMKGFKLAQYMMGILFTGSKGVTRNLDYAFKWFELSSEQDYVPGILMTGIYHENGISVPKNIKIAERYYLKAGGRGNIVAQYKLACIYNEKLEFFKAKKWLKMGSYSGCSKSQYMLAVYYENGIGNWRRKTKKNKALLLYKKAAFSEIFKSNIGQKKK